jgi:hypothetical protein
MGDPVETDTQVALQVQVHIMGVAEVVVHMVAVEVRAV